MKHTTLKTLLLTASCLRLLSATALETPQEKFCHTVKALTGTEIKPEFIAANVDGYMVPAFEAPYQNRNHFSDRSQGSLTSIKSLVLHYTVINFIDTLKTFTADIPERRVSATYVVSEAESIGHETDIYEIPAGQVIQIVPESKKAWHAGVSQWRELTGLNDSSLGIEVANKGFTEDPNGLHWYPFDKEQMKVVGKLSRAIVQKYHIPPTYVVGHADIAPQRKQDPGILFPWGELYTNYGVGAWLDPEEQHNKDLIERYTPREPLPQGISVAFMSKYLKEYGYPIQETDAVTDEFRNVLRAFKAHFSQNQHPEQFNAPLNHQDMYWIWALTAKYKS
ncbi:N-acetylmuramoyl-L-alanine amidase [Candidatus Odyssella thessalonicensis]|uniref:N-acetylmuramoyl-L-alanine amidase n=1 Tax=Candidatus Odyssella thessalonicensis TaxID=84647 RepID=UPI000225B42F|nr:N-acetylmuramoyl-L-alanine amidase [Candidatus Odyssella thessalonicensis]